MPTLRETAQAQIEAILLRYPTKRSAVLPLCYLAQQLHGYLGPDAVCEVAQILNLDPTEVQSLVGFYTLLREKPAGRYVIQICHDLPCSLHGAEEFVSHVCKRLGVGVGETTADAKYTVETVMCIAACDRAPVAQINLEYHENLDPARFDAILTELNNTASTNEPAGEDTASKKSGVSNENKNA